MHGNFFADHFQGGGRHFDHAPRLLPYAGIILTMSCIVIFLLRQYVIEPLVTKCYGKKYTDLDEAQRRSLVNHFVAGGCKFFLVAFSLYPAFAILSGKKSLESPYATSRHVKIGDGLIFTFEIFTAMYIFELFFRKKVSWISAAHHIGAITIAQTGTVLFLDPTHRQDAQIEFVMCLLWGKQRSSSHTARAYADNIQASSTLSQSSGHTSQSSSTAPGPTRTKASTASFSLPSSSNALVQ